MPALLLETKLCAPRPRSGMVPRRRLTQRLERGAAARLLIVSAPAGFGKTTLLTEWLTTEPAGHRVAWLALDAGDNDRGSFWAYVVEAKPGRCRGPARPRGRCSTARNRRPPRRS